MTQEHKELLLKDLCSRLPYGVKVQNELGRINKLVIGNNRIKFILIMEICVIVLCISCFIGGYMCGKN